VRIGNALRPAPAALPDQRRTSLLFRGAGRRTTRDAGGSSSQPSDGGDPNNPRSGRETDPWSAARDR
jgi:hypothetical protein